MGSDGEEEEDALERRGFQDGVDLRLGAMMQLTLEIEKEREREIIKKAPNKIQYNKYRNSKVRMHENVTCKYKYIKGSAQSKPTSTQQSNKVNTHLKCMKHCYNAHVMQCVKFKTQ